MEGVRWQLGNLPLKYAVARGWSPAVGGAPIKAYPAAATTLDPYVSFVCAVPW